MADQTNNENNASKKLDGPAWKEVIKEANDAFESLYIAQSKNHTGATVEEWQRVFGPSFNISNLQ